MGSEAVFALMKNKNDNAIVIAIKGNETCYIPLKESVEKTISINKSLKSINSKSVPKMRSLSFSSDLDTYIKMSKIELKVKEKSSTKSYTLGVIHVGSSTCGVNSLVRSFVRQAIARRCKGIYSGYLLLLFFE
jgi:6-phosphofructokinase 1